MTAVAARPRDVVVRAQRILGDSGKPLRGARILVVGVTYKPGVADIRDSPAVAIIDMLVAQGADVAYTDPHVDTLHLPAADPMCHLPQPADEQWDLIVVHTIHQGQDHEWLSGQPAVLDTTYRLAEFAGRHVL